jgi:hypothetical protein
MNCVNCVRPAKFVEDCPNGRYFCSELCQVDISKVQPPLRVRVVTWNIAEINKSETQWLNQELNRPVWSPVIGDKSQYDVLCVNLQEDTSAGNFGKALKTFMKNYEVAEFNNGAPGKVVRTFVFYKHADIKPDTADTKGVCLLRKVAFCTKSTVAVSLESQQGIQLVFLGSHFPVDPKKTDFGLEARNKAEQTSIEKVLAPILSGKPYAIMWAGDLNYRVTATGKDQLDEQRRQAGGAFSDFKEAPRRFFPTCKLNEVCDRKKSDTESQPACYAKNRIPSFCDRILYKSTPDVKISAMRYESYADPPAVQESDHNLVFANFLIRLNPN